MSKNNQNQKSPFSQKEEEIIDFWKENKIFEKSVEKEAPQGNYVFYDGPPFITGLPHYATLLPSIAKDAIPRYFTMKGYRVERIWGWDCHGIPAENRVEKNLGLRNKKDVEKLGVEKFVCACREYVSDSSAQWEWYIDRIGRWVDFKNAYKTMDLEFMESVIWAFKTLYDKDLIYEGYRTSLHCPRCATPLSKFEITMDTGSYKEIEDDSIIVEFKAGESLFFLAWTTTPWTLPGNLALAVGEKIDYLFVESKGKRYVLAKEKVEELFKDRDFKIVREIKGKDLVGLSYEPIFDLKNKKIKESKATFKVYGAEFVNTDEGTGIVHIAPNFGEDDFELGKREGMPIVELMDENGIYTKEAGEWDGYYFKKATKKALTDLEGKMFLKEKGVHSYPFCYRCDTSLIHKTQKAWYLRTDRVRKRMIETNKNINWVPNYFKEGRFKHNLENAPDWCLSRSRYWGSPVPVWKCNCGSIKVVESIAEIEKLSGKKIDDLHRPKIDEVTFSCKECGGEMKRVLEVLDCWFESGSMPFAQFNYPFKRKKEWSNLFPADFIIEYTGQLRGWFYYLHLLSNALFDSEAFKNVIVTGVLAGNDGRKMSKSLGNYPDPKIVLDKYGSDALRIYFMSNPIMVGGDTSLSEIEIKDALRKNIILLFNVFSFYKPFAEEKKLLAKGEYSILTKNVLDKWIIARLNQAIKEMREGLDSYNLPEVCSAITLFIDDLSTWYIRRSRNRFKKEGEDAEDALKTTSLVLHQFSKAIAPIMPFIAENIWQQVTGNNFKDAKKSVHLTPYPDFDEEIIDKELIKEMEKVREIASYALKERADAGIKVRQPLLSLTIRERLEEEFLSILREEINVKEIIFDKGQKEEARLNTKITPELKREGNIREIIRVIQSLRKDANLVPKDKITLFYNADFLEDIFSKEAELFEKETGVKEIKRGELKKYLAKKKISLEEGEATFFISSA